MTQKELELENKILKLEIRLIELENEVKQLKAASGGNASNVVAPTPGPAQQVIAPSSGAPLYGAPNSDQVPSEEEIRNFQKVKQFMDFLGACR